MDFIAVGEILIDFLPGSEEGSYIRNAGGAPANVAISAARNGLSSGMYCKAGDDDFGTFLIDTLRENNVTPLSPQLCRDAFTTLAFVTLTKDNERSFSFARRPGADMMLDISDIREEDLSAARIVHAGSFSLSRGGKSVAATEYALRRAHELGTLVSFDINYRNTQWDDDKQACADAVAVLLPYIDLLKVSEEEVDMIGGTKNIPALMKEYGIAVVVLTLGSAGAQVFFENQSAVLSAYKADVIADTTGAGDAFWGGFLSRLLILGADSADQFTMDILKDAVNYGNVSGSLAVRQKGAISSLPTRAQIEAYLEKV